MKQNGWLAYQAMATPSRAQAGSVVFITLTIWGSAVRVWVTKARGRVLKVDNLIHKWLCTHSTTYLSKNTS